MTKVMESHNINVGFIDLEQLYIINNYSCN